MFATRRLTLLGAVLVFTLSSQSHPGAQPMRSKIEVDCHAFQKNSDGSWTLGHETTVNEGIYGLLLKPGTFRKNEANVFGYDLTRVLEQDCVNALRKQ